MLYAIICEDIDNSLEIRNNARPAHLAYLGTLQKNGQLILAGPHPAIDAPDPGTAGFSGSLIVAEFPSIGAARAWADSDPYNTAGVFKNITIKPFNKVLP